MKTIIRLANPEVLGKKYTSSKACLKIEKRGFGVFLEDGSFWVDPRYTQLPSFAPQGPRIQGKWEWFVGTSDGYEVMMAERTLA